jgi:CO/xanthine dehydrogenase Mo-binding subunit/CO/xanthine dehydrogenase FAD-binding subunit
MIDSRQSDEFGRRSLTQVGRSVRPQDWDARTSGSTVYASDVSLPGMLIGAIVRSPHPYARIVSIDTREALRTAGVHAVVTSADLPAGKKYIHHGGDQSDRAPLAADVVRFIGQEVAAVAAEDRQTAVAAAERIHVKYRPRKAPTTIKGSLRRGATRIHPRSKGPNISAETVIDLGSADLAFREATHITSGQYRYPQVSHATMEPDATVAWWRPVEKRLHIWTSTQSPYFVRKELGHLLSLEAHQIEFHEVAVGGGFGAKSKVTEHEAITALLSMISGRPVKIVLTREEQFATSKSRHEFQVSMRLAMDDEWRLTGIDADVKVDNGAYNHTGPSVMATGLRLLAHLYRPIGVRARGILVDTAKLPGGQFRGYGGAQMIFALESELDELARTAGADPLDLRIRNANPPHEATLSGARIGNARMAACLEAAKDAIGWTEKKARKPSGRGLGVAVAIHGSGVFAYEGANRSSARVELDAEGRVRVRFGGSDAGTGQRTLIAQIVAEELSMAAEDVQVVMMDTSFSPVDQGSWSSRGTHYGGNAAWQAARGARDRLVEAGRQKFAVDDVWLESGTVRSPDDSVLVGDLVASMSDLVEGLLICEETYEDSAVDPTTKFAEGDHTANASPSYAFAAHAVELEVDPSTGMIAILDYVAVHDVGRVINPVQAEGQIIGGVIMGLGAALREELTFEQGRLVNPSYMNYGLARAADAPPIRPILLEERAPTGPFGAKNVGELSVMPVAAAIANAVRDATGIRVRELPITPDKIVGGIPATTKRARRPLWRRPSRWWISAVRWLYPRGLLPLLHRWGTRFARVRSLEPVISVVSPQSILELSDLAARGFTPIGGGTDVQLLRQQGLSSSSRLVVVGSVAELRRIEMEDDGSLHIGAGVTLARLAAELGNDFPVLNEVVQTIASPQIRSVASVGGNLLQEKRCAFYRNGFNCYKRGGASCPCYAIVGEHRFYHAVMDAHRCQAVTPSDLATVFIALRAEVELMRSDGRRRLPLREIYTGPGEHCLVDGEIMTHIIVPRSASTKGSAFEKLQLWSGDFAVASAAVSAEIDQGGRWHHVSICLGGLAPTPWEAKTTPKYLEGRIASGSSFRQILADELWGASHPLAHNAWKIDPAVTLAERAMARLSGRPLA